MGKIKGKWKKVIMDYLTTEELDADRICDLGQKEMVG